MRIVDINDVVPREWMPRLRVLQDTPQSFKLLRLQCLGTASFDNVKGVRSNDAEMRDKFIGALGVARQSSTDVFVAPEYSTPLSVIEEIIRRPDLRPEYGQLWVLPCEASSWQDFLNSTARWREAGVHVVDKALEGVTPDCFVCYLLYIFVLEDHHTVCFIPQMKLHAASDPEWLCEGSGLTLGKTVFRLVGDSGIALCSLLCADALDSSVRQQLFDVSAQTVVLHPQLNERPKSQDFSFLRRQIFDDARGSSCIYVSCNWASGSSVLGERTITVHDSWSCIYVKEHPGILTDRDHIMNNLAGGLAFAYWQKRKTEIWYTRERELLQLVHIAKPALYGTMITAPRFNVGSPATYIWNNAAWQRDPAPGFADDLNHLVLSELALPYRFPLDANVADRDVFFGLCFGHLEVGELAVGEDEGCFRLAFEPSMASRPNRLRRMSDFMVLVDCLEKGLLPKRFGKIRKHHQLGLYGGPWNLIELSGPKRAHVCFVPDQSTAKAVATNMLDSLIKAGHEQNICVFTRPYGQLLGAVTYPEWNDEISAARRAKPTGLITEG